MVGCYKLKQKHPLQKGFLTKGACAESRDLNPPLPPPLAAGRDTQRRQIGGQTVLRRTKERGEEGAAAHIDVQGTTAGMLCSRGQTLTLPCALQQETSVLSHHAVLCHSVGVPPK